MRRSIALSLLVLAQACSLPDLGGGGGEDVVVRENPFEPTDSSVEGDGDAPGFAVTSVDPARGPITGGTRVAVAGFGFLPKSRVYFGASQGLEAVVEDETTIRVTTPPHPAGLVSVRVQRPDGKVQRLEDAFLFEAEVEVEGVEPAEGPAGGGQPVTVRGRGFVPGSRLLVGGRLAQDVHVLDASTVIGVTPPGRAGPRDVLVAAPGATAALRKGYRYVATPAPARCSPARVAVGEPATVRILGTGLAGVDAVALPWGAGRIVAAADGALDVEWTAPSPGYVDVRVSGPGGAGSVPSCVLAVDPADLGGAGLRVLGVVPPFGPASGGGDARVITAGPASDALVFLDGVSATVLQEDAADGSLRVRVPAGSAGPADVRVATATASSTLEKGYTYVSDVRVDTVVPSSGPESGGTLVTLAGGGLDRVRSVRIGTFPAALAGTPTAASLQVVTAPSSPGRRDVVLVTDRDEQVVLPGAFVYGPAERWLAAVSPATGATAGGTIVSLAGSGLEGLKAVEFGDAPATAVDLSDPARIVVRAPARETPGPVDVTVRWMDGTTRTLALAYAYFDPTGAFGGVWGDSVDGAVNVTVLDSYTSKPVPLALVILGSDASTPLKGRTDPRGHLTLSDEDLFGPVQVTGAREDYSTFTIAGIDAENVTLFLDPMVPIPSGGGGGSTRPLPPGTVSGIVLGTDKFLLAPPVACAERPLIHGTLCRPCGSDGDCGAGSRCVDVAGRGLHCAAGCTVESDCPDGWSCYALGGSQASCLPSPGRPEVRCGTTTRSMYGFDLDPGPGYKANDQGIYALNSRLGDVAVYCVGGVVAADGVFEPLVMGLIRHVGVAPGVLSAGNDVRLDIPLDRELDVRLLDPPGGPDGPLDHVLNLVVDLGSDGILRLWDPQRGVDADHFVVRNLPRSLDGPLEGATLTILGEADSRTDDDMPYSVSIRRGWLPGQGNRVVRVRGGRGDLLAPDLRPDATGGCPDGSEGGWVLGTAGRLFGVDGHGVVTGAPSLGTVTMRACAVRDGTMLAVGDHGWIVRREPLGNTRETSPTSRRLTAVAWADDGTAWAAGEGVLLHRDAGGEWRTIDYGSPAPLHAVVAMPGGRVLAFGAGGLAVRGTAAGVAPVQPWPADRDVLAATTLGGLPLVVGARGGAWIGDSAGNLAPIPTDTITDLRAVRVTPDGAAYAAGALGTVLRLDAGGFRTVPVPGFEGELTTLLPGAEGTALAFSTDAVTLGPYLKIPAFQDPRRSAPWTSFDLTWTLPVPPIPSLTYTRVYGLKGQGDWTVIADGPITHVTLPDLEAASGILAMPKGAIVLQAIHILIDGFRIDAFDQTDLYSSSWRSWMMFETETTRAY